MQGSRPLAILTAAILIVLVSSSVTNACRCVMPPPPLDELARRDAVFSGRVVEIYQPDVWSDLKATVERIDCWKGRIGTAVTVVTPANGAACGIGLQVGAEYLIYGNYQGSEGAVIFTGLCTRTQLLAHAQMDVEALGEPNCTVAVKPEGWGTVKRRFLE